MEQPRPIFDVYIRNQKYKVWDIPGKEHPAYNGGIPTWWVCLNEPEFSDVDTPFEKWDWYPYEDRVIPRQVWSFTYEQDIDYKPKWNSISFSTYGTCSMFCNGDKIYEFRSRDYSYTLGKLQTLQVELTEHPYNFLDPKSMDGSKIWYKGLPSIVKPNSSEPWRISVFPDLAVISKDEWFTKLIEQEVSLETDPNEITWVEEYWKEWIDYGGVSHGDALSDGDIKWSRK